MIGTERRFGGHFLHYDHEQRLLEMCPPEFREDPHHPKSVHIINAMTDGTVKTLRNVWKWKISEELHDQALSIVQCIIDSQVIDWKKKHAIAGWLFSMMVEWNDHYLTIF